jgi:peroxin-3
MISATTRFLKKHQRKFFITLGITGGSYLIGKWVTRKLCEMQEKAAAERTAREKSVIQLQLLLFYFKKTFFS